MSSEKPSAFRVDPDAAQIPGKGVFDDFPGLDEDLEIRRVSQVHGGGLEDRGHERVYGLDLEVGVIGQNAVDRLFRQGGEPAAGIGDDLEDLGGGLRLTETAIFEPGEDALLHLSGGVLREGNGQDVGEGASGYS